MTLEVLFGAFLAVALGFGIPLIINTVEIKKGIEPIKDMERWLKERGLEQIFKQSSHENVEHHSLPPEEAQRRDLLIAKGREYGLDPYEAEELRGLLDRDARSDFASGIIGFLAFLGIAVAIGVLIQELTRKR